MPSSDYYLPRASLAPELTAAAVDAYRAAGWGVTMDGRVTAGTAVGPCGSCRRPTVRYGPHAVSTLCPDCRSPQ